MTHLDLFNNDICNTEDYRSKVFKMLPNLKYLDDADADLNEAEDSEGIFISQQSTIFNLM